MQRDPIETSEPPQPQFYTELARWWPLISPVEEYAEEAAEYARIFRERAPAARSLLELGSGGGHCAAHLKRHYALTLSDISADMLSLSQQLNPDCEHMLGDMRTIRLERSFDLVFIHDAIEYMTSESDLAAALATAFAHCKPGGVALFASDVIKETFVADTDHGGSDGPDGAGVRYLEWTHDPDPNDTSYLVEYVFVCRESDGRVHTVSETHRLGVFSRATWLRLLREQGFEPEAVNERPSATHEPRVFFLGRRPG